MLVRRGISSHKEEDEILLPAPQSLRQTKIKINNSYCIVKVMFARDGSMGAGSEARGECRDKRLF